MAIELYKGIKVLAVYDDYLIASRGYHLVKYDFHSHRYGAYAKIIDAKYALFSAFKLSRRLLRAEVNRLYELSDGCELCIAKKGIFKRPLNSSIFKRCFKVKRGSRPLNICIDGHGKMFFGEYFSNMEKEEVHIYKSVNNGETWHIVYSFEKGCINHVHGIFYDSFTTYKWIVTGDRTNECIIGYTNDDFKSIVEVFRGGQEYRTCNLFFYHDFVVFATDSQYMRNEIKSFDRKTKKIVHVAFIQGTAIKGGQVGNISFLSTTVEPSEINKDSNSYLWISKDGLHWSNIFKAKKDSFPSLFQFGSIEFPQYNCKSIPDRLFFSGRALKHIDGSSMSIDV